MQGEMLADRYTCTKPLGGGAAGEVWEAWDAEQGRAVAVKVLRAPLADDAAYARFRGEVRALSGLSDPHLAVPLDSGRIDDGRPFVVSELVAGRSLAQMLREQGPLPWQAVADLGRQAAGALAAAHRGKAVHRAVKPTNILISDQISPSSPNSPNAPVSPVSEGAPGANAGASSDGQPGTSADTATTGAVLKLVDFAITAAADGADAAPVPGSAAYTAPEQAVGHPAGPAADLYALGCVLYEALAGHPPFPAATDEQVVYQQVHDEPARLAQVRPDAHPQLRDIVTALLAKNPQNRPRSADAVARDLAALVPEGAPAELFAPPNARQAADPGAAPVDDDAATQFLPPVVDTTEVLSILPMTDDDYDPAPRGASGRGLRDRKVLLLGGFLLGALLALGALIALLAAIGSSSDGGGKDSAAVSASSAAPSSSAPAAAAPPATTAPPTPSSASPSSTKPSASPTSAKPSTKGPDALAGELNSAYASASQSMRPQLQRETRGDVADITESLREGDRDKAADKARDLRRRLNEAQQRGRWGGDARLLQVLNQVAAA